MLRPHRNNFNKNIYAGLGYTFLKYIILAIAFIKTGLIAYHLGPELLGAYALVILTIEYLNYSNLGVFFSMTKDISLYLSNKGNEKKMYLTQGSAIGFSFISVFILVPIYFLFKNTGFISLPDEIINYSLMIIMLVLMYQLKQFILRFLRLFEKYFILGLVEFLAQVLNLLGIIFFIEEYQINAVLLSILIPNVLLIIIGFSQVNLPKLNFDFNVVKKLVISGLPLLFYNIFLLMLTSIDRLMIGFYYSDLSALGLYQLSLSLSIGLFTVFNAIAFLFQPKWIRFFSAGDSKVKINEKIESMIEHTYLLEAGLVFLAFIGICLIPFFIEYFLTDYVISIIIAEFLLLSLVTLHLTFFSITYLTANHHQFQILPALIQALILAIFLNYIFVEAGYGLYGIAFAKIIAFLFYGFLIYKFLFKLIDAPIIKNIIRIYSRLFLFLIPTCVIIYEGGSFVWILIFLLLIYAQAFYKMYQFLVLQFRSNLGKS